MNRSFLSIFTVGLLAVGLLSFTDEYHPQEPQEKTTQKTKRDRKRSDSVSTRRTHERGPALQKTDSLPQPGPDKTPLPDSIGRGMH